MQILLFEMLIAAGLLLGLLVSLEAGFRVGLRAKESREVPEAGQLGAVQGSILGLLGLLLGFSFAGAAGRFMERQEYIVQEANAIGTAFLRADLIDEPHRSDLQQALADYTAFRVEASKTIQFGLSEDTEAMVAELHARIWHAARSGVTENDGTMVVVLGPVNEVIDLHALRVGASRRHLPGLVLGLLIGCSSLAIAVIGYGCGLTGRRHSLMTVSLTILICTALWTTIDLDHPRVGIIRLDDRPLTEMDLRPRPLSPRQ